MKTLLLLFLLAGNSRCIPVPAAPVDSVYICDSPGARKYHLKQSCKGLRNCQHRTIKVSLDRAKRKGRTLCGYEK